MATSNACRMEMARNRQPDTMAAPRGPSTRKTIADVGKHQLQLKTFMNIAAGKVNFQTKETTGGSMGGADGSRRGDLDRPPGSWLQPCLGGLWGAGHRWNPFCFSNGHVKKETKTRDGFTPHRAWKVPMCPPVGGRETPPSCGGAPEWTSREQVRSA